MRKYTQNRDPSVYSERAMLPSLLSNPQRRSLKPGDRSMLVRRGLHPPTISKKRLQPAQGSAASWQRGGNSSSVQDPSRLRESGPSCDLSGAAAWLPVPNALSAKSSWIHLSTEC